MERGGIVSHRREKDVVGLRHRPPDGVLKFLADMKLFEVESGHDSTFVDARCRLGAHGEQF
jgi:hypothetical protein